MTSTSGTAVRRLDLSVQGMTCAACANRVESKLNKVDGVVATVNYALGTATIDAPDEVSQESLCSTVDAAGYSASPASAAPDRDTRRTRHRDEMRSLLIRLAVAVVLFIPVMDLSVMVAVAPSTRFAGWQWVLLALSIPVVTYCAWPFHSAAVRNLRHGVATMDTLVSIGITVASLWSVYTIFGPSTPTAEPSGVWEWRGSPWRRSASPM